MKIKNAQFLMSNTDVNKCPDRPLPEYAFIGRSNVGKSSLINAITGQSKLAKISGRPGKTQLINHFLINQNWFLVDLPGYGYAQVSKKMRADFEKMIETYMLERKQLVCMFVLVDIRLEPQKKDLDFMQYLGEKGVPFSIIFTKADKLKTPHLVNRSVQLFKNAFLKDWEVMPDHFITSSVNKRGLTDVLKFIDSLNQQHQKR